MRKHMNTVTVLLFLVVLAALLAQTRGLPTHGLNTFGFSGGG